MTVGILTEKPSAARHFAAALGGESGNYNGQSYLITHARGHLYEFVDPHRMVKDSSLSEGYKKWDLDRLPWDPEDLSWKMEQINGSEQTAQQVKKDLSGCDEIVIATDVDPTGEGGMIAVNAFQQLGLSPQRYSRMYFTDETESSLQKAFDDRKPITALSDFDEYRKALYRSKFDFMSMQWTRAATNMARQSGRSCVLRQGRLKSAMVKLVGDQLKAHSDYVKKPFFQNRFQDENKVKYVNPEEPRFDTKAEVPGGYTASSVIRDSTQQKKTAPPRLLDLAALSSMLVSKGVKAKQVLDTYQKMYEAQVVSYPRTEDKTITPEQFDELVPLVDRIADVVGVDTQHLTHRQPRKTHVKTGGAHGANRPGPKVPSSLESIETQFGSTGKLIYETLATNYLAMLAEDYTYEQQKGHLEKYPDFKGIANVPTSQGWKSVYDPTAGDSDNDDQDENESSIGLGHQAEPFVYEGSNKRPEHPSMKWLMKQLEKRDVGTGATRTSTYSEVTSSKSKYPLLVEKGKKLTLAEAGDMSWRLLPGTRIGDLSLTEQVYATMREIAEGTMTAEQSLAVIADWVREDIATMQQNAEAMRTDLGLSKVAVERAAGTWQQAPGGPKEVQFKKTWSGHTFTEYEIEQLLAGETISFSAKSRAGRAFTAHGKLGLGTYKGKKFVGFQLDQPDKPTVWSKHTFTQEEIDQLLAGQQLEIDDFVSAKTGNTFSCRVGWDSTNKRIVPDFSTGADSTTPPRSWCQHRFSDEELEKLAGGEPIFVKDFTSKKGKTFAATVLWKEEKGSKKIVPSFG
jgi:DNA topoisomerase-3